MHSPHDVCMLDQRQRRWSNINHHMWRLRNYKQSVLFDSLLWKEPAIYSGQTNLKNNYNKASYITRGASNVRNTPRLCDKLSLWNVRNDSMAGARLYIAGSVSLTVGQHCFNIPCLLGYHCPHGSMGLHINRPSRGHFHYNRCRIYLGQFLKV